MEEEEKDDDDDNGRDSGLSSHPSVVVVVVGGSQVSGSTLSASDSPFDPYNANVLLAADVIYNVGKIPSLIRATHKFILLPDRPLPPRCGGSAQTVAIIFFVVDSHWQWRQKEED